MNYGILKNVSKICKYVKKAEIVINIQDCFRRWCRRDKGLVNKIFFGFSRKLEKGELGGAAFLKLMLT